MQYTLNFCYLFFKVPLPTQNHRKDRMGEGIWPFEVSQEQAGASLVGQLVKNPPAMRETWVRSLRWEDPLDEGMAPHSSSHAWRIPMDRGAWWAAVHGVAKSWTHLSDQAQHWDKLMEETALVTGSRLSFYMHFKSSHVPPYNVL